jgi:hypothetical protein
MALKSISTARLCLLLGLLGSGFAATANADWHSFWHSTHVDYARVNAWPQPFTDVDARQVQAPFAVMKHNGWRAHNTIGHELFRDGDAALTAAGNRRVTWIASQAPLDRRTVYVLQGRTHAETEARLASVHAVLSTLQEIGAGAQVVVTDIEPAMAPGAWANNINRRWINELPAPRLPSVSASGAMGVTTP